MSQITEVEILSKKVEEILLKNPSMYEVFHENTKLNSLKEKMLGKNIMGVLTEKNFLEASHMPYKTYTSNKRIPLEKNFHNLIINKNFTEILLDRRSVRKFINKPISFNQLSYLLYMSYGINDFLPSKQTNSLQELRTVPSAGGLYPLEIYLLINNVENLEQGLYHYNVKLHCLELLKEGSQEACLPSLTSYSDIAKNASILMFVTAIFPRLSYKYGDRSYRFAHLDAGHLGQNIYLTNTAMKLGTLAVGGFFDDEINEYLNINGVSEGVVYEFFIGHKDEENDYRIK
ncbi:SagB/ThcOx family dehydrogenase [Lysinibacillus sp. NPDC093692]|uniref:SagB/ThcOx family dehydrogenase n=1 Tax=Lysinibacillus sp. NPDC093692 TaxID=3390578 RepID=UPI003D02B914